MKAAVIPEQRAAAAAESWPLVERVQAGDLDAYGDIWRRYHPAVLGFVASRISTRALAEDIAAETFVRALRTIGRYTWQGRDFAAVLITIAGNLIRDHYKSGRYRIEYPVGDVHDETVDRAADDDPERTVVDDITNAALLAAVARLTPDQRDCIVLRFLRGLNIAETAAAMGKDVSAIKALQYRATRALPALLPAGFEEARR
jgi:RNA polymerase sigma-70 factor (ECF subfamily)